MAKNQEEKITQLYSPEYILEALSLMIETMIQNFKWNKKESIWDSKTIVQENFKQCYGV